MFDALKRAFPQQSGCTPDGIFPMGVRTPIISWSVHSVLRTRPEIESMRILSLNNVPALFVCSVPRSNLQTPEL